MIIEWLIYFYNLLIDWKEDKVAITIDDWEYSTLFWETDFVDSFIVKYNEIIQMQ